MTTVAVMYTLKRNEDGLLEGPINKKVYASYAPKRHAVAIARREADKRGFNDKSGKVVQIVTDGDNDLERDDHDIEGVLSEQFKPRFRIRGTSAVVIDFLKGT
jgi:hypothetical protein